MSSATAINTGHEELIHDVAFDFYGKRVATASSDRTVRVFDASSSSSSADTAAASSGGGGSPIAELRRHEGPVWGVAWAHPKFGTLLASCGYDRRVIVWRGDDSSSGGAATFAPVHEYAGHTLSVNGVAWAPHEHGLVLASASSDGTVAVLSYRDDDRWDAEKVTVDAAGVNAVSWAPALAPATMLRSAAAAAAAGAAAVSGSPKRFAAACCDGTVRVFEQEAGRGWTPRHVLRAHVDWVRDVAWAPSIGLPVSVLASCSQDGVVIVWSQPQDGGEWKSVQLPKFPEAVWRVSWSVAGNTLAVACGDNRVTLWKEAVDGEWKCVSSLDEPAAAEGAPSS